MKLAIIGSGNVAWHIAHSIVKTEHIISYIAGRNEKEVKRLSSKVSAIGILDTSALPLDIDLIVICVNDSSISEVVAKIPSKFKGIVAHTSGAIDSQVISQKFKNSGIFYPLYSFPSKRQMNMNKIPFLITSKSESILKKLLDLAKSISKHVYHVTDEERLYLHLAAVYANNFSNFMMTKSFEILDRKSINKEMLLPIIKQSAENWTKGLAKTKQTGPAIRNDQVTIEKHLKLLQKAEEKQLYSLISQHIKQNFS